MKKSLVIAILLLALTVSAFAGSFADVPANHWAYEAVNKLVAAGLITGYPDGTFKGQNALTRYEVATILARLLNSLAEMREEMMDQVTFMIHDAVLSVESGLSKAQAEDVQAILQAVIEKNAGGAPVDALTAEDAAELYGTMLDLAIEFDKELMDLGIRVSKLEKRVADLEEATSEKPAVSFNGEYKFELKDYSGTNPFTGKDNKRGYYKSPFDYDLGKEPDYVLGTEIYHQLDLNTKVENGPLSADLNLTASKLIFRDNNKDHGFRLDDLSATLNGRDFTATLKKEQKVGMRPYLFGGFGDWDGEKVDGVVVETANGRYFIDAKVDNASNKFALAGSNDVDLLGGFNLFYGFAKLTNADHDILVDDKRNTTVLGVNKTFNIGNFAVTPEFALSEDTYFAVNAEGNVGKVDANFKYENVAKDFRGIADMLNRVANDDTNFVSVEGKVEEDNAINFIGFDVFANAAYRSFTNVNKATSKLFNVTAKRNLGKLEFTGKLEFQNTTDKFDNLDAAGIGKKNLYEKKEDKFDKKAEFKYPLGESLTAGAVYALNKNNKLSEHDYTLDFAKGVVKAGVKLDIKTGVQGKETHLYAGLNTDKAKSFDLLTLDVKPYAEYKTWTERKATNILAGIEAAKELTQYARLTAGYEWFDVENMDAIDEINKNEYGTGLLKTTFVGLTYDITEDVAANLDYKRLDFEADTEPDFKADLISAGVSVAF